MTKFYVLKPNGIGSTIDQFEVKDMVRKTHDIEGFSEFIDIANDIKESATDYNLMGIDLKPFVDDKGMIRLKAEDKVFGLTDWSLSQLSQKMGVPANYAQRMADAGKRDLFVQNFESWIDSHHAGKNFFVRTVDDTIRGFLSDSYFPSDTEMLLPVFRDALQSTNMNFQVHKGIINPEYTNIRVISDREINVGGDPHFVGMSMTTSDVGRAATKIEFFIYRSACTNGMLFGKHGGTLFRQKHVSRHMTTPEHFIEEMKDGLKDLDRLTVYAEDLLKEANQYRISKEEVQRIVNQFKAYGFGNQKELEFIQEEVDNRIPIYDSIETSLWGVSNAFTEVAQLFGADKSEQLENYAGHILHARLAA